MKSPLQSLFHSASVKTVQAADDETEIPSELLPGAGGTQRPIAPDEPKP